MEFYFRANFYVLIGISIPDTKIKKYVIKSKKLTDLENYKEYYPYTLINNEVDFISKVISM
ncbi:DUF6718 family protein [Clostridium beijerinckii]|uniref:DUF6718 family protein n=1 Tax=Clostridium beijerinckii TaxID=1520 RepID=UPI003CD042DC